MQRRSSRSTKNPKRKDKSFFLLFGLLVCLSAFGDPPIEDASRTFLHLNNGTWLRLKKINWEYDREKFELLYGKGKGSERKKDIIWSKVYETDNRRAWVYAYFLRLKPGHFAYDLDGDGNKEIGVATYDMGNNMIRRILIFSILKDRIVFVREHGPYNIAADEPVFKP
jgi:hypothetical protein